MLILAIETHHKQDWHPRQYFRSAAKALVTAHHITVTISSEPPHRGSRDGVLSYYLCGCLANRRRQGEHRSRWERIALSVGGGGEACSLLCVGAGAACVCRSRQHCSICVAKQWHCCSTRHPETETETWCLDPFKGTDNIFLKILFFTVQGKAHPRYC